MAQVVQIFSLLLPTLFLYITQFSWISLAKTVIEPCNSSDSCTSVLSYYLPFDSKVSEIAYRFQINTSDLLATNAIVPAKFLAGNQIIRAKSLIKVPISCPCVYGIRRSVSITHIVQSSDSVESISQEYGGLVSGEQISSTNGISANNPMKNGQSLVIPLPCTCFNNSNNGAATVYMSYVVQPGESLGSIGAQYGATVNELEVINGLGHPHIDPGDVLAIPLPACSSANLNWNNDSLIVPEGSYALTANDCIICGCDPTNFRLQCSASGLVSSCSHLLCKGSNMFIGDVIEIRTASGCNITTCAYRGHFGGKIHRSLVSSSQTQCSDNQSLLSPLSTAVPLIISLSPFPSPSPLQSESTSPVGSCASNPMGSQKANSQKGGEFLAQQASFFCLLLLELASSFVLF